MHAPSRAYDAHYAADHAPHLTGVKRASLEGEAGDFHGFAEAVYLALVPLSRTAFVSYFTDSVDWAGWCSISTVKVISSNSTG